MKREMKMVKRTLIAIALVAFLASSVQAIGPDPHSPKDGKYFSDGDVHKYFSPYDSPYDSYINFMNVLSNLRSRCTINKVSAKKPAEIAKQAIGPTA